MKTVSASRRENILAELLKHGSEALHGPIHQLITKISLESTTTTSTATEDYISDYQCGFRRHRGTVTSFSTYSQISNKHESVRRVELYNAISELFIPQNLLRHMSGDFDINYYFLSQITLTWLESKTSSSKSKHPVGDPSQISARFETSAQRSGMPECDHRRL